MEKDTVLYKHIRKSDNIIFYIGIGDNNRPYIKSGRNQHWHNTVKKYGYNIEIIADNLTWDEACDLETKFIAFYGRKNLGLGNLVNKTNGGEGVKGLKKTEEQKLKNKIASNLYYNSLTDEEKKEKWGLKGDKNPFYGKNHKEENKKYGELNPMFGKYGELNPMFGKTNYGIWVEKYGEDIANEKLKISKSKQSNKLKGENNPIGQLTESIVLNIRKDHSKKIYTLKELCEKYNIKYHHLQKIIYRQTWKHI
jgi:hypothetical protein